LRLRLSEEGDVQFNVPLLPIVVEAQWRPLRPFRFSLRGLLLAVSVAAVFFAVCAYLGRANQAIQFHIVMITSAVVLAFVGRILNWFVRRSIPRESSMSR
jgi:hypothetical protein